MTIGDVDFDVWQFMFGWWKLCLIDNVNKVPTFVNI